MFNFSSIKHKIMLGFSIIVVLVLLFGIYNIVSTNQMLKQTDEIVDEEVPLLISNQKIAYSLANQIVSARAYVQSGKVEHKEKFIEYAKERQQYADVMADVSGADFGAVTIDEAETWSNKIMDEVFDEYEAHNIVTAEENLNKLQPTAEKAMDKFEEQTDLGEEDVIQLGKAVHKNGEQSQTITIILTLLVIVLGAAIGLFTSNKITAPLKLVRDRMREIAAGKLNSQQLKSHLNDETGQLIAAANELSDNMKRLLHDVKHVSEEINDNSTTMKRSASEVKVGAEQISMTMGELASGAERQSAHANDLTRTISGFVKKVTEINDNGEKIKKASDDVLDMTNNGSALMDSSSSQMQMIDAIFHDAVQKVESLDAHSKEISELVSVIKNIAEQTNLLALNAAIEAARAGEHGKGFAVVADEVRKLAEGVSSSVSNITGIVQNIQQEASSVATSLRDGYGEVEKGTKQTEVTKQTFEQIRHEMNHMANHITTVSGNLVTVEKEAKSMNNFFREIAMISEESAASIEQTTAQSEETSGTMGGIEKQSASLQALAATLESNMKKFQI